MRHRLSVVGATVLVMFVFAAVQNAPQQVYIPKGLQGSWAVPLPDNHTLDVCTAPLPDDDSDQNPWRSIHCPQHNKNSSAQPNITTEFTWTEFIQEYLDKDNNGPELDLLRRLFPIPDSLLPRRMYYLLLRVASDGTLIDLVNRHNAKQESASGSNAEPIDPEDAETMKTEALEQRMEVYARKYLRKVKDKPYFTLFDYFEDVYKHQFHEWTWHHERRRRAQSARAKRRQKHDHKHKSRETSQTSEKAQSQHKKAQTDGSPDKSTADETKNNKNKGLQEVVWVEGEAADLLAQELGRVFVTSAPEDEDEEYMLEVRFKD